MAGSDIVMLDVSHPGESLKFRKQYGEKFYRYICFDEWLEEYNESYGLDPVVANYTVTPQLSGQAGVLVVVSVLDEDPHTTGIISGADIEGGEGYGSAPTLTFPAPAGVDGRTATGYATISGGVVNGVVITDSGQGYTSDQSLTVTVSGGSPTTPATITATVRTLQQFRDAAVSGGKGTMLVIGDYGGGSGKTQRYTIECPLVDTDNANANVGTKVLTIDYQVAAHPF